VWWAEDSLPALSLCNWNLEFSRVNHEACDRKCQDTRTRNCCLVKSPSIWHALFSLLFQVHSIHPLQFSQLCIHSLCGQAIFFFTILYLHINLQLCIHATFESSCIWIPKQYSNPLLKWWTLCFGPFQK